jgi:molecular chaperone DnaK
MGIWDRHRLRHSVGIETKGGRFTPLIPKGTPLPASVTETFTTADLCQPSIQLKPFQGENPLASFNEGLGVFQVTEIPPAGPGEPLIYVTFHVDAQGALSITARDDGTERDLPVLRR